MPNFKLGGHVLVNNRKGFISEIISDDSLKVTFLDGMTAVVVASVVVKRRGRPKRVEVPSEVHTMTVYSNGTIEYHLPNGIRHRKDGPAVDWMDGTGEYWQNGKLHRTDGPAVIGANGYQAYYVNGRRHRTDGPAVIRMDGSAAYFINDQKYTKEEFEALST